MDRNTTILPFIIYAREILSFMDEEYRHSLSYQYISYVILAESSTTI